MAGEADAASAPLQQIEMAIVSMLRPHAVLDLLGQLTLRHGPEEAPHQDRRPLPAVRSTTRSWSASSPGTRKKGLIWHFQARANHC